MAAIPKSGTPSLASPVVGPAVQTTGLVAGEALGAFDAVRIGNDGRVYRSIGAAANANAEVIGFVARSHSSGDRHVTIYHGDINVEYGSNMTPGTQFYLSGSVAGGIDDAPSTGGTRKLGFVLSPTRVRFYAVQGR